MDQSEEQEFIVHVKCPTENCKGHTFISIPEDLNLNLECKLCGITTEAKEWLS